MKNRILALFLAVLMLVAVLPVAAVAAPLYEDAGILPTAVNSFWNALPSVAENGTDVVFKNNWTVGRLDLTTGDYELYDEVADSHYKIMGVAEGKYIWTNGGGMYGSGTLAMGDDPAGLWHRDTAGAQFRYTATNNGVLKFSVDKLILHDESADKREVHEFHFQLKVNGKKVWPAEGDYFTYSKPFKELAADGTKEDGTPKYKMDLDMLEDFLSVANFPASIDVKMGDAVDFVVLREDANMIKISPCVQYTELKDTPSVSAKLSVGEGLALNMYVNLDPATTREGAKAGLYYWTKKPESIDVTTARELDAVRVVGSNTQFVYESINAVDMSKELWVLPYTYVEGNAEIFYGQLTLCSVSEYARQLYTAAGTDEETKDYVRELVNYGANAEIFFGTENETLPNHFLSGDEIESEDLTGNDVWAQSNDGTTGANITHASLLLDEKLGFKFVVPAVNGVSTYKLQIATKADFSDATEVNMTKTADGKGYRGIYYLGLSDITTTYYVRVTDGSAFGNTLTYSVESYITRRCDVTKSDEEWYLLTSLLALGYAADALE